MLHIKKSPDANYIKDGFYASQLRCSRANLPISIVRVWVEYISGASVAIDLDALTYPPVKFGHLVHSDYYPDTPVANNLNHDYGVVYEDESGTGLLSGIYAGVNPQFLFSEYCQGTAAHYPMCFVQRIYGKPTGTMCYYATLSGGALTVDLLNAYWARTPASYLRIDSTSKISVPYLQVKPDTIPGLGEIACAIFYPGKQPSDFPWY